MNDRKKLIQQYKMEKHPMGIYQIRNIKNGKIFIESSLNLNGAFNSNRFMLTHGSHNNKTLQKDWASYGEESFVFEIVEMLPPSEEPGRNDREEVAKIKKLWLEKLMPYGDRGYNRKILTS